MISIASRNIQSGVASPMFEFRVADQVKRAQFALLLTYSCEGEIDSYLSEGVRK